MREPRTEPRVMDVKEVVERVKALTPAERVLLFREAFSMGLSDHERAWLSEYLTCFNERQADVQLGVKPVWRGSILKRPNVAAAVEMQMAMRDAVSELKAEYVKQYMLDVLELCPLDFLEMDEDGDFVCDIETFRKAPRNIQRLVESFEIKWVGKRKRLKLEFVSKSATLAMAAKHTLVQRFAGAVAALPWEEVAGMLAKGDSVETVEDELERRIAAMPDVGAVEGPVEAGAGAVA